VIPPRHRTRNPADVFLEIARALRGGIAGALPFASFEEYLKKEAQSLFAAQTGSVFGGGLEEAWNRLLERSGWWSPAYSAPEELWDQMNRKGGWWDSGYSYGRGERAFATPSRRFEFYSQAFAASAGHVNPGARDDRLFLPHQPAAAKPSSAFPLLLMPFEVLPLAGGSGAHLPYLQQIAGPHLSAAWESWLEIHPETARKLGIADGDLVWVESRRSRAQVRARLYAGAHPDAVHLPLGYGHIEGCEWGRRGVNPLRLLGEEYEAVAALPRVWSTPVRVYRS
jgi:anaerobic selenocysteine-containing dehydrogenase